MSDRESYNEVKALIALLDDTDQEVFQHVSEKLFSMGPAVIEVLEDAYTSIPDQLTQERIENIIHSIQFSEVKQELLNWAKQESDDMIKGMMIMNRYQFPLMDEDVVMGTIQKLIKDAWLGLNMYQSPLEQIDAVNQVIFGQFGLRGSGYNDDEPRHSFLGSLITSQKGNPFSIGLLYLAICQQLDLPVYGVCLRSHFVLVRSHETIYNFEDVTDLRDQVLFYINPYNKGLTFGEREIRNYLKKASIEQDEKYFLPASNLSVMIEFLYFVLEQYERQSSEWKSGDLKELISILEKEQSEL